MDEENEGGTEPGRLVAARTLKAEGLRRRRSQTFFFDQRAVSISDAVLKRGNSFQASKEEHRVCVTECEDQDVRFTSRLGIFGLEN